MAPAKKKTAKNSPKSQAPASGAAGTITGPDVDSPTGAAPAAHVAPAAVVSSTGKPRKQALVPAPPIPAMVRPKRNAEKKFYDDIEDERPQHLIRRNKRAKGSCCFACLLSGWVRCVQVGVSVSVCLLVFVFEHTRDM